MHGVQVYRFCTISPRWQIALEDSVQIGERAFESRVPSLVTWGLHLQFTVVVNQGARPFEWYKPSDMLADAATYML